MEQLSKPNAGSKGRCAPREREAFALFARIETHAPVGMADTRQHETLRFGLRTNAFLRSHPNIPTKRPRLPRPTLALTTGRRDLDPRLCGRLQQGPTFQNRGAFSGPGK